MQTPERAPSVDDLAMEYLRGVEVGQPPDMAVLAARLPDAESRDELRAIVETAIWASSAFPEPFRPGVRIANRYVLLEALGSGGFGKVWRARDETLGVEVVLKLFHSLMDGAELESTLQRARTSLSRWRHEGVARLLDSGRHRDTVYLAREFVPGRTLDQVLAASPARADANRCREAVRIALAVLEILVAAHQHGIHHGDLRPGNVLVGADGRVLVLDFGLSGLGELTGVTRPGRLFGTVAYMAPEQLDTLGLRGDARTDLYQCGLVLYELLTRRPAHADRDRIHLLNAVRTGRIAPPRQVCRGIPRDLADICMRALARLPGARYATAAAFADDLGRWLAGGLPAASRRGPASRACWRLCRSVRRHRLVVLAAGLVALAATAWLLVG
ncbi:MAG TPA: serine/threonine-protein kinase [Planctomycetota bacterium]|nr:serine/threonine-protein kinase [Planctomycetota bacterium]